MHCRPSVELLQAGKQTARLVARGEFSQSPKHIISKLAVMRSRWNNHWSAGMRKPTRYIQSNCCMGIQDVTRLLVCGFQRFEILVIFRPVSFEYGWKLFANVIGNLQRNISISKMGIFLFKIPKGTFQCCSPGHTPSKIPHGGSR